MDDGFTYLALTGYQAKVLQEAVEWYLNDSTDKERTRTASRLLEQIKDLFA